MAVAKDVSQKSPNILLSFSTLIKSFRQSFFAKTFHKSTQALHVYEPIITYFLIARHYFYYIRNVHLKKCLPCLNYAVYIVSMRGYILLCPSDSMSSCPDTSIHSIMKRLNHVGGTQHFTRTDHRALLGTELKLSSSL